MRVDSIEQAIRDSGTMAEPINDAGYRVAYAIAEDNLRLGRTVISDSVNPIHLSRDAWISVANRAQVRVAELRLFVLILYNTANAWKHDRRTSTD